VSLFIDAKQNSKKDSNMPKCRWNDGMCGDNVTHTGNFNERVLAQMRDDK
jgi:hypothetical protein